MAAPKGNQYAKGHGFGRPKIWTDDAIENEASELMKWADSDQNLWIKDFAHLRGYSPQRYAEWRKSNKVFSDAFEYAKDKQERKFFMGALNKDMDMVFVKYFMPRVLNDRPVWLESFGKEEKETKASDLLEFIGTLMQQAKAKPDANCGT